MSLLPEYHEPDDARWIKEQLERLPASLRQTVSSKYSACFKAVCDEHKGEIAETNLARREANTRLRAVVKRYGGGGLSRVHKPSVMGK